ncbi:MAG: alpha-2-macroglobulin family protein [Rubellimicrobium sp.]|nr:alpha-2-macroglobulin family protein [Rubellimicrobium sp.]
MRLFTLSIPAALLVAAFGAILPGATLAGDGVPPSRVAIWQGTDFPGADLGQYFDTTLDTCQATCLADDRCTAFTFNTRNNSCFPKASAGAATPFAGAISGMILPTDPAILAAAPARAATLGFLREDDLSAAETLAREMGRNHSSDGFSAADLADASRRAEGTGDLMAAFRFAGAAIAVGDSVQDWLTYARLGAVARSQDAAEQGAARARVLPATIAAYLRAADPARAADALEQMAAALEADGRGRLGIDAIRLALTLRPGRDLEAALERLVGMYGLNIVDTQVDSDPAVPRICTTFSEDLVQAGVDYAPFVQVPGVPVTVDVTGSQLCIEGVQHGQRLAVTLRQGLPSASGETLARNVDLDLYIRDRAPQARFASRAYVLPRTEDAGLPIETVNVERIDLVLSRLSDRNILRSLQEGMFAEPVYPWQAEWFDAEFAETVWQGSMAVQSALNRDVLTRIPMADALRDEAPGLYVLTASVPGQDPYERPPTSQWFVLSDLGLSTLSGTDGLTVDVRSLSGAAPVAGAGVQLLNRANAVLAQATTDAQGLVRFDPGLTRGTGAAEPAMVVATLGDDMGFLSLLDPAFDLSDRGVEGRPAPGPIDVFLATDRGVYRAGETVHLTALMRDDGARAVPGVPLTAILIRPDGVEYARVASAQDVAGGHVFALPVAPSVPRGTWTIEVRADTDAPALASTRILVEDFLPERIDVALGVPPDVAAGAPVPVDLRATYLFGPPAGDLAIEGEVVVSAADGLPGWPGYVFGRQDAPFGTLMRPLDGARTAADGSARLTALLPDAALGADRPLTATLNLRVAEGSGRPVERQAEVAVAPAQPVIGIAPLFDGTVPENGDARFRVIALGPDLAPQAMEVQWTVNRLVTRYQWYMDYGSWFWDPIVTRERVASGTATLGVAPVTISAPVTWGEYEVVVESTGSGPALAASTGFWAAWYGAGTGEDRPDVLEAGLDAARYAPGDTATLRIVPRFAGTAIVTVLSDRVIHRETVAVTEGENLIPLTVTEDWGTGAYVTATVIRPMDVAAGRNPSRALGLVHATVDPGDRALSVVIEAPLSARPRAPLEVALDVRGALPGEPAFVTLAAVDVGILNMTRFSSPDPSAHFFGQRRLGVELRDLYGRLIDGMTGAAGDLRVGGDAALALALQSPPPTEELVAWFQGPVAVDDQGRATFSLDMPAFNGTVRLMAVAWSARGVGQASADVLVRDPVVVTASLPRFMAPGDRSRLLLEFTHAEGPAGEMALSVTADDGIALDPAAVPASVTLAAQGRARLSLPVVAGAPGIHELRVTLTTPDGRALERRLTVPVALNDPEIGRTLRLSLAPGQVFTLDRAVFDGFLPGTGQAALSIGPLARFDAAGLLGMLDRYPYGCTEQVTSAALPLVYFGDVAQALGLGQAHDIYARIAGAITAVLANQDSNGAFGLWGPWSGDMWLDAYVTDFLSRARAHGHEVPQNAWRMALDNLRNRVNYYPEFDSGGEDLAYALMVLAREGEAAVGDLRYYADVRAAAFATPLAQAQLGAALAFYGDQPRADSLFARAAQAIAANAKGAEDPVWRADYGTRLRDAAAVLTLALEAGSQAVDPEALSARIAQAGDRVSTQEAVWSLMAANALIDDLRLAGITVNGAVPVAPVVRVGAAEAALAPTAVTNNGTREIDLTVTTFGVPETPPPAGGQGYAIRRDYYTLDGTPADPGLVVAGSRLVAVLTVDTFGGAAARLMVADPLPAGFEIDNPGLLRGGDIAALPWLETIDATHAEFRQDRFLAAVEPQDSGTFRLAYIVRAVSPGVFHHPAASVEDMYRPQMRAHTGAGTVTVTE